ncbi:hypothetical protein RFI_09323, partial [Reticulomyxa filosa]
GEEKKNQKNVNPNTDTTKKTESENSPNDSESQLNKSVYLVEPGTREAIAAEQRLAMKQKKPKQVSTEERRAKTKDLLFGDGLKEKELTPNANVSQTTSIATEDTSSSNLTESDIVMASGKAAESAFNRMKAKGSSVASQERKERTAMLIHGDLLKDNNATQPLLRPVQGADTPQERKAQVEQALRNLQNCNSHTQVPATAKLLVKIITNSLLSIQTNTHTRFALYINFFFLIKIKIMTIDNNKNMGKVIIKNLTVYCNKNKVISAETLSDQEKFGKLRLANPKIKQSFVDLTGGLDCLVALGFEQRTVANDANVLEEYMIFDFSRIDKEISNCQLAMPNFTEILKMNFCLIAMCCIS